MIDERIASLVLAIDGLPDLFTFSSCGGHPDPQGSQEPEGHFQVSFSVEQTDNGWASLTHLTWAAVEFAYGESSPDPPDDTPIEIASIVAWFNGDADGKGCLDFEIRGGPGVDPNGLARVVASQSRFSAD